MRLLENIWLWLWSGAVFFGFGMLYVFVIWPALGRILNSVFPLEDDKKDEKEVPRG
jgi:hypothetical protein